jgi:GGDEF domain-containing protein
MARRATSAWTDTGLLLSVYALAIVSTGLLAGTENGVMMPVYAVVALGCGVSAVWVDWFAGLGVGVLAAAVVIGVTRLTSHLGPEDFGTLAPEVAALIVLGWVAGVLGQHLRELSRSSKRPVPGSVAPAFSSLGLLDHAQAMLRLDEELARSRRSRRYVGLLMVAVEPSAEGPDELTQLRARRAVARLLESIVADTDIPFALDEAEFGAILPETSAAQGWRLVGPLVDGIRAAAFADRTTATRRRVVDCARVRTGLVFADHRSTSASLLADARRALRDASGSAA